MAWVNVFLQHRSSAHTIRGFLTTTSTTSPPAGMSRTRCFTQACTRVEITPQPGHPSSRPTACTTTRRPPSGRSTASIAGLGPASLALYDVSTLYFETDAGDGFRESGFSKERRLEPQITIRPRPEIGHGRSLGSTLGRGR